MKHLSGRSFDSQNLNNTHPDPCPICHGTGTELTEQGARICACRKEVARQERVARKTQLLARIDPLFANVTLADLQPRADLHPDQPRFIAKMKEHPFDNYYFCGRNDVGKTLFMWALYENAVNAGRKVYVSTLLDMILNMQAAFKVADSKDVAAEHLRWLHTDQGTCSIFLDDIDKARPTEYVAEFFFGFVDTIYRYKHQLVVTSQLDPENSIGGRDSLIDHFEKADARYAVGIVRRIVNDQTHIVRML